MSTRERIAAVEDVPTGTTRVCTLRERDSGEEREAILTRRDGEVVAWLNYCQHYTHINIDKGSGAEMRDGEFICTNHGAYFEADSGRCTYGPCEGAYLNAVAVERDGGSVYLVDDDYEFLREGPIESDGTDLESKSNYKF